MTGGDTPPEKVGNRIMSLMLLTCYNSIQTSQALEIASNKDKLDVFSDSNKKILDLENWNKLFREGDEEKIKDKMSMLSSAIKDIQAVNILI